jgi:hypothetical protein
MKIVLSFERSMKSNLASPWNGNRVEVQAHLSHGGTSVLETCPPGNNKEKENKTYRIFTLHMTSTPIDIMVHSHFLCYFSVHYL